MMIEGKEKLTLGSERRGGGHSREKHKKNLRSVGINQGASAELHKSMAK